RLRRTCVGDPLPAARFQKWISAFDRVDTVAFPALGDAQNDQSERAELIQPGAAPGVLGAIARHGRREDRLALAVPAHELLEVLLAIDEGLVDINRQTRLNERTRSVHMLPALVRRNQNGVHLAD